MTTVDEALAGLTGHAGLLLNGQTLTEDISAAIKAVTVVRTIDSAASTLSVDAEDDHRTILKSGILGHRVTAHLAPFTYELAQVKKSGPGLSLTFEDPVVSELRRHNHPMSVGAQKMTHVQFVRRMLSEVKWIKFHAPYTKGVIKSKAPLTRGDPTNKHAQKETTWDAIVRLAQERGWRVFTRGNNELWYVPDAYLMGQTSYFPLSEDDDAVDNIDFDMDEGKPVATLTVTARSGLWQITPGSLAVVSNLGPANGKWIIQDVSKTATSTTSTITCIKSHPVLPEPESAGAIAGGLPAFKATEPGVAFVIPTQAPPPGVARTAMPGAQQPTLTQTFGTAPPRTKSRLASDFLIEAVSQAGKAYLWGSSPSANIANPKSFDCSGLVQWSAARVGVVIPRTSGAQYAFARSHGTLIPVSQAKHIRGALLFLGVAGSEHVVISMGDGVTTIEARGKAYGTNEVSINRDNWSGAALIPGMRY
jgi:cell wall-associated NlpC family hydrolase